MHALYKVSWSWMLKIDTVCVPVIQYTGMTSPLREFAYTGENLAYTGIRCECR